MPSSNSRANAIPRQVDEDSAIDRVMRLMAIRGKSCEEAAVVEFIVDELARAGVAKSSIRTDQVNRKSPVGGQTGNLIVSLPGTKRGPRRLLMAHLDTVPLCVGSRPVRKGMTVSAADSNTALGGDDRSGTAVVLTTVLEILKQKLPHPPLTLFWPVQEEIGLYGARLVSLPMLGSPKLCFNWDGGSAAMACIGATGSYDIEIEIDGIASHAGVRPEGGVSAIAVAGLAIADLQQHGWHGLIVKGKNSGTSNIGIIGGGDATNVVTAAVKISAEVRSHDRQFRKRLVEEFRKAFVRAARSVKNDLGKPGHVRFTADLKYESFRLNENESAVEEALRAIRIVGLDPQTRISNGGLDANWLSARGLPTVTLGSGQQNVHTVSETLNLEDFLNACRIGLVLATGAA
ncbi:MAG TPA: M20/M25/M40 family metallo-hydrolase [Planctomycetaceae bacterium]|nr:M20/M25/M40 family metallo-hydrolase [Planctomycetaceae bacterium]